MLRNTSFSVANVVSLSIPDDVIFGDTALFKTLFNLLRFSAQKNDKGKRWRYESKKSFSAIWICANFVWTFFSWMFTREKKTSLCLGEVLVHRQMLQWFSHNTKLANAETSTPKVCTRFCRFLPVRFHKNSAIARKSLRISFFDIIFVTFAISCEFLMCRRFFLM